MKQQLTDDIEKRTDKFLQHAKTVHQTHDAEAIHKMRVTYKKLRARLRLAHGSNKAHIPGGIKELYAAAGTIRDLQLHRETVHTYFSHRDKMPFTYLCSITEAISQAVKKYDNLYQHITDTKAHKELLNSLPKHLHKKEMQQWHDAIESAAITLKDGTAVEDNDVHQLRKYNKDLMYVSDYIPAPAQSKEIAEITGRFMDNTILLQILEERKQDIPHKELKILQDAAKDWYMQKENKLAQVKQLLATSR